MAEYTSFNDLSKLAELFNPKQNEDSDSGEEETSSNTYKAITPSTIGKSGGRREESKTKYKKIEEEPKEEIVDPEEELLKQVTDPNGLLNDWKKCPHWDISYKQQVTPQDVFLQMSCKTPSTASCEDMIVSVHLPGEKRQNIDLKITKHRLDLVSPRFKLNVPLPHPVDPQKGNAEFDADSEKLKITLRMDREFDYVNF